MNKNKELCIWQAAVADPGGHHQATQGGPDQNANQSEQRLQLPWCLSEIQAIHTQMEGIVLPALEALCGAEALDKGTLGAQELVKMSDRFAKQTVLLKHHITGARAATT